MPTFTFRLSDAELEALAKNAKAQGCSMAAVVRDRLGFGADDPSERLDDLDRRVSRLEGMAGL